MEERFFKGDTELIIVPYGKSKYCVLVVCKDNDIEVKFPFNNKEEARKWVDDFK